jgi:hypothetical protein
MSAAGKRRVIVVSSALMLLGATLLLLICTEPIAVRFWFAIAVTAAMVSFCHVSIAAAALRQCSHILTSSRRVSRLSRETGHDEHGSALL